MIVQEIFIINNKKFKHTYSSDNKFILQIETDVVYNEAYDTLKSNYHYIETTQEINDEINTQDVPR